MPSKTVRIPNITCGHCVKTIAREVGDVPGVISVRGDEDTKTVAIEWSEPETSWTAITELLEEIDYAAEE